jgi:hypothetical protein
MGVGMVGASFDTLCKDFPEESEDTAVRIACIPARFEHCAARLNSESLVRVGTRTEKPPLTISET